MTVASVQASPTPRHWRPRFSLRTLVLGVLVYASLWTATEIYGGHHFRTRIEAQSETLHRATVAWSSNQAREASFWQNEGFFFPAEDAANTSPPPLGLPPLPSAGIPGGQNGERGAGSEADVTSFCQVETLAVAPFVLRVQYTYACTDTCGRSLPMTVPGMQQTNCDAQGWVVWFFGYVFRIDGHV